MKKFLTVLLVIAVMFTFSFGSAFAAETYTSADYQNTLWGQWTNTYSLQLTLAEQGYTKMLALQGDTELYNTTVKASDLGLKASSITTDVWTAQAITDLNEIVRADVEKAVGEYISKQIETNFGKTAEYTTVNPATLDIGAAVVYETKDTAGNVTSTTTLQQIIADYNANAAVTNIDKLHASQEAAVYDAVAKKIAAASEAAYTAENANKVANLKAEALNEIAKVAGSDLADAAKAAKYVEEFADFKAAIGVIPTTDDTDYNDANTSAAIADAVADFVSYGLTDVYGQLKLVGGEAVDYQGFKHLMNKDNDKIFKQITAKKAEIFGVEVADITKVTKAEATKVNNAMRTAIIESGDVVAAYAAAIDVDTDAERIQAVRDLYSAPYPVTTFLNSLNKAIKAIDVYADVVAEGKAMKDTYKYGVKVYDDAKVDQAVKDAETLVYADLKVGFKTNARDYIMTAAADGGYSVYAENFEYEAFLKAIDAAQAKFYKNYGEKDQTPQVKVLYGDDKTAEADYVYLKATYATTEASNWTDIADDACEALEIAESYADIDAALAAASADMSELMKAEDEAAVTAAIAKYSKALADSKAEAIKIMGLKDYSQKAYDDAYNNGIDEIEAADTLEEVVAAYTEAEKMIRAIPTKAELAAAQKAVIDKIAALPTTSSLTAADKDKVVEVLNAYMDYADMPGSLVSGIYNTYTFNADLDTVLRLVGKDIQDRVDAMVKSINKLNPATDNGAAALIELEDEIKALIDEAEAFNDLLDDVETVDSLNVDKVADVTNLGALKGVLNAENDIWMADLHVLLAQANKAKTASEKKAVLAAYDKLTDRQKYKMEQNLKTLIEEFQAEISSDVEALKITARSTAKKGSITVKWTVKGDTSDVEGYEIWKSTKKNSGYKKAFTTTKKSYKNTKGLKKGTRYYYKVRAFAHVDGKKITSDWSNKAFRIAK